MAKSPTLPPLAFSLARAAAPWKRSASARTVLPEQESTVLGWRPESSDLARYKDLIGSTAHMPLNYPQIPVMAMTLDLVSGWSYPVRAMGMVHLGSVVECLAAQSWDAPWDLRVRTSGGRHVKAGLEFDVVGEVAIEGVLQWRSRAVYLSRSHTAAGAQDSTVPQLDSSGPWEREDTFEAAEGVGRAFGSVSGDINPIHLHALSARLFGFKRAIAHGWWTTGRVPALLGLDHAVPGRCLEMCYRRPIDLPSRLIVESKSVDASVDFVVKRAGAKAGDPRERPLVLGRISS